LRSTAVYIPQNPMLISKNTLFGLVLLVSVSCSGGNSPTSPSSPATPSATVSISNFAVTASISGTGRRYSTSFTMTETSGRATAIVNTIRFSFAGGGFANADPTSPMRIAAGTSASSGAINLIDDTGQSASISSMTVTVGYSDDGGKSNSATSSTSFTQPIEPVATPTPQVRTFTLAGVVVDLSGRAISNATVAATDSTTTRRTSTTDGNGYYSIAPLREGSVSISVTASSYQSTTRTVTLSSDQRLEMTLFSVASPPATTLTCGAPQTVTCINGGHLGTPTAKCGDGAWSCSTTASGTCSGHGGIACRVCPGALCQ
jgi:hypothetical protein